VLWISKWMPLTEAGPLDQLLAHSITYRIAVGPQAGRKVFTLQTLPACDESFNDQVGKVAGFSLHVGVVARADERKKLERLCRYISRPAVSEKRLALTANGNVRYQLKTPYRDGTRSSSRSEVFLRFAQTDLVAGRRYPRDLRATGLRRSCASCACGISASMHVIARLAALVPKPRVNLTLITAYSPPTAATVHR
jgi:hypothetical protein